MRLRQLNKFTSEYAGRADMLLPSTLGTFGAIRDSTNFSDAPRIAHNWHG
jgi:hypothetical protein